MPDQGGGHPPLPTFSVISRTPHHLALRYDQPEIGQKGASMTYTTFEKFRSDFEIAQLSAKAVHGVGNWTKAQDPTIGWKLYQNAFKPALGFQTFGRHITGEKAKELNEFRKTNPTGQLPDSMVGMNHSEQFFKNFGVVNDAGDGSVLLMGGQKWSFTINDCWVLGGVHAGVDFYAASPISKANMVDDRYFLSITGRELIGLASFGYEKVTTTHGIGFVCKDKAKAEGATLPKYQEVVGYVRSKADALKIFDEAGFALS
jgi:hypothetical protein